MQHDLKFDTALLKALFFQLRKAVGSQDAAAAYLDISRQRVGQLESAHADHAREIPTWGQVFTLEQAAGRSIVFAALADLTEGKGPADIMGASIAAVAASSAALQATAEVMADGKVEAHEIPLALDAARRNRDAADLHVQSIERQAAILHTAGRA